MIREVEVMLEKIALQFSARRVMHHREFTTI
jgi:hypothetical protein